jgi:hypothetical protein
MLNTAGGTPCMFWECCCVDRRRPKTQYQTLIHFPWGLYRTHVWQRPHGKWTERLILGFWRGELRFQVYVHTFQVFILGWHQLCSWVNNPGVRGC